MVLCIAIFSISNFKKVKIIFCYINSSFLDKTFNWRLDSSLTMRFFTQPLHLFLIIAMVLSPIQLLFAAQSGMQTANSTTAVSDTVQNDELTMLDEDCNKHGNCQNSVQCGNCPLSLGISQIKLNRDDLSTQIQSTISDVSLYSTDLLPEYRPPRYS